MVKEGDVEHLNWHKLHMRCRCSGGRTLLCVTLAVVRALDVLGEDAEPLAPPPALLFESV